MKIGIWISLSGGKAQGKCVLIDREDYELVKDYIWHYERYAYTNIKFNGYKAPLSLHRLILNFPNDNIDHKNRDKLDCRKENLRLATHSQNAMNCKKRMNTSSIWKGVCYNKEKILWEAYISVNKKRIKLGYCREEYDAATVYNFAAEEYHSEFALLNAPVEQV